MRYENDQNTYVNNVIMQRQHRVIHTSAIHIGHNILTLQTRGASIVKTMYLHILIKNILALKNSAYILKTTVQISEDKLFG